jgi:hypothetical protein
VVAETRPAALGNWGRVWVFAPVSVITNGNKAPGGFRNHVFGTNKPSYSLSEIKTPAPACFGNLAEKSGASCSGAFRGLLVFFYNHVLPL